MSLSNEDKGDLWGRPAVERASSKKDPTLWRWEQKGIFPKRVRIGPNSVAWYSNEIEAWKADPQGWGEE